MALDYYKAATNRTHEKRADQVTPRFSGDQQWCDDIHAQRLASGDHLYRAWDTGNWYVGQPDGSLLPIVASVTVPDPLPTGDEKLGYGPNGWENLHIGILNRIPFVDGQYVFTFNTTLLIWQSATTGDDLDAAYTAATGRALGLGESAQMVVSWQAGNQVGDPINYVMLYRSTAFGINAKWFGVATAQSGDTDSQVIAFEFQTPLAEGRRMAEYDGTVSGTIRESANGAIINRGSTYGGVTPRGSGAVDLQELAGVGEEDIALGARSFLVGTSASRAHGDFSGVIGADGSKADGARGQIIGGTNNEITAANINGVMVGANNSTLNGTQTALVNTINGTVNGTRSTIIGGSGLAINRDNLIILGEQTIARDDGALPDDTDMPAASHAFARDEAYDRLQVKVKKADNSTYTLNIEDDLPRIAAPIGSNDWSSIKFLWETNLGRALAVGDKCYWDSGTAGLIADTYILEVILTSGSVAVAGISINGLRAISANDGAPAWVIEDVTFDSEFTSNPVADEKLKADGSGGINFGGTVQLEGGDALARAASDSWYVAGAGPAGAANNTVAIGPGAGANGGGVGNTFIGPGAGENQTGSVVSAVGFGAAANNTGVGVTAIGTSAANFNTFGNVIVLGAYAQATKDNQAILGASSTQAEYLTQYGGAQAIQEYLATTTGAGGGNGTLVGTGVYDWEVNDHPTRRGRYTLALHEGETKNTVFTGYADGRATVAGAFGFSGVDDSLRQTSDSLFIGVNVMNNDPLFSIGIGKNAAPNADASSAYNVAVGRSALANLTTGSHNFGLGYNGGLDVTTGWGNIAIGSSANFSGGAAYGQIAIGYRAETTKNNQMMIGGTDGGVSATNFINEVAMYANASASWKALTNTSTDHGVENGRLTFDWYDNTHATRVGRFVARINHSTGEQPFMLVHSGGAVLGVGTYAANASEDQNGLSAFGHYAGQGVTTSDNLTALGYSAGQTSTGGNNTYVGAYAGRNGDGGNAVAVGMFASDGATTVTNSTVVGVQANQNAGTSTAHVFGYQAGLNNTGDLLSAYGYRSAMNNIGAFVTAYGYRSAEGNEGSSVTALGHQAALGNTAATITAVGLSALQSNIGASCTGFGHQAGYENTAGNVLAIGQGAAYQNSGEYAVMVGRDSGNGNTGNYSTSIGGQSAQTNTGAYVAALGYRAGRYNTGNNGTFVGAEAGLNNDGADNTMIGYQSGGGATGLVNVAFIGALSGYGSDSVNAAFIGREAGRATTGPNGTAIGYRALYQATATSSTAIGFEAGSGNTGTNSTFIGREAGKNNTFSRVMCIGMNTVADKDDQAVIGSGTQGATELKVTGTSQGQTYRALTRTSTLDIVDNGRLTFDWFDNTHSSRVGQASINVQDYNGENRGMRLIANGRTEWGGTLSTANTFAFLGKTTTTEDVEYGQWRFQWLNSIHANRTSQMFLELTDFNATRQIMQAQAVGIEGRLAFFGATPVAQQAGGAQTAGASYGATEQDMLQKVYDAVRAFGLMA